MLSQQSQFLYLNSNGWKTGRHHRIEIWFVEYNGRYYIMSERKKKAHWVQNIMNNPIVSFTVNNKTFDGKAKIIEESDDANSNLIPDVCRLMYDKYRWSDGLIVELCPQ